MEFSHPEKHPEHLQAGTIAAMRKALRAAIIAAGGEPAEGRAFSAAAERRCRCVCRNKCKIPDTTDSDTTLAAALIWPNVIVRPIIARSTSRRRRSRSRSISLMATLKRSHDEAEAIVRRPSHRRARRKAVGIGCIGSRFVG